jgi:hypothetical protein
MEPLFNSQLLPHCVNVPRVDCEQRAKHLNNKQTNLKQTQTHETKIFIFHTIWNPLVMMLLCVCVCVCWSKEHQLLGPVFNVMYGDHYKSTFIPTPPSCCLKRCLVVWWRCSKQLFKCHHHYGQPIKTSHFFFLMILSEISVLWIFTGQNSVSHYLKATIHPKYYVQTILPFIQNPMSRPFYHSSKILCTDHFTGASWDALKHLSQNWQ